MIQLAFAKAVVVLFLLRAFSVSANPDPIGWNQPPPSAYPGAFWWWMGSAVNEQELERNISELSDAGIRTLRLEAIYKGKQSSLPIIQFLTDEWNQRALEALRLGDKHGVEIDLWGNGWPFGGPWIKPEHAARRLEWDNGTMNLFLADERIIQQDEGFPIIAVVATPPGEAMAKATVFPETTLEGQPAWKVPPGTWDLYVFRNGFTGMKVKRATTGGGGPVLDHFSTPALMDYLQPFGKLIETVGKGAFGRMHEDSYEVNRANWTGDLLAAFSARRGYDLQPYLPALISETTGDLARRVRHDYRQTIQEMLIERHLEPWMKWVRERGMQTSFQAQGCPGHLVDLYGLADQPDPEAFGREGMASDGREKRNGGFLCTKFASSSAHLNGRKFVSSETFTWLEDHFGSSLDRFRNDLDYYFLAGVNHIYFHSTTYSPADVPFPGWLYYASSHIDACQPWWEHLPEFSNYIARCQSVLQTGRPGEDILLLYPIHDLWHDDRGAMNLLQYCQVHNFSTWCVEVGKDAHDTAVYLWDHGWKFDWYSDNTLIHKLKIEDGRLAAGDGRYQAVVIPQCQWVHPDTPSAVKRLVHEGGTVIVIGEPPRPMPTGEPQTSIHPIPTVDRRALFSGGDGDSRQGRVVFLDSIDQLPAALAEAGAIREPMADHQILSLRKLEGKDSVYFIRNSSTEIFDGWLPIGAMGRTVWVGDPISGQAWIAESRQGATAEMEVRLQLLPTETRILRIENGEVVPDQAPQKPTANGTSLSIDGPWNLSWTPLGSTQTATIELQNLTDWREIEALSLFSGKVLYEVEFDLNPAQAAAGCQLVLEGLHESATVRLNGEQCGIVWTRPYRLDLSNRTKPGPNRLELEVINLLTNRIIQMERSGVHIADRHLFVNYAYQDFDADQWAPLPSGLVGPVQLMLAPNN